MSKPFDLVLIAIVGCLLGVPNRAVADGQAADDFARLQERLKTGDSVIVRVEDGSRIKGRLLSVSPERIALRTDDTATDLPAEQVSRRHSFVTLGVHSDINDERFMGIGSGIVFDLMSSWVSVGAQGDLFISNGYFAGRGGPIGQFNFIPRPPLRPFAIGGVALGENDGPMFGAGVEFWPRDRIGFRASVQDYVAPGPPYLAHQVSVQFGLSWR